MIVPFKFQFKAQHVLEGLDISRMRSATFGCSSRYGAPSVYNPTRVESYPIIRLCENEYSQDSKILVPLLEALIRDATPSGGCSQEVRSPRFRMFLQILSYSSRLDNSIISVLGEIIYSYDSKIDIPFFVTPNLRTPSRLYRPEIKNLRFRVLFHQLSVYYSTFSTFSDQVLRSIICVRFM